MEHRREEGACGYLGGCSSVVRALTAKARDLGLILSNYCLFFSLNVTILDYKIKIWLVFGSSTIDSSTRNSSIIFALQLLTASHKQLRGGSGGQSPPPPVLAFSLRVLGLVSQEYDVLVFSL